MRMNDSLAADERVWERLVMGGWMPDFESWWSNFALLEAGRKFAMLEAGTMIALLGAESWQDDMLASDSKLAKDLGTGRG